MGEIMPRDYRQYDELFKSDDLDKQKSLYDELVSLSKSRDPQIIGRLGRLYRDGKGTEINIPKAIQMLRIAALRNISWAKGEYVDCLLKTNEELSEIEAFSYCYANANDENPIIECRLAQMYKSGIGVSRNIEKAISWMSRAVGYNKGWIAEYIDMLLLSKNEEDWKEAYNVAINNDNTPNIAYKIATMYKQGKGVEANTDLYKKYLAKAAEMGLNKAIEEIKKENEPV